MSMHTEEVSIRVDYSGGRVLIDWDEVDAILARPQFSNLRRVTISPVRWSGSAHWQSTSRLSLCHACGILGIQEIKQKYITL